MNRLTFGATATDTETAKRVGLDKGSTSSNPCRIAEDPDLERKFEALPSVQLSTAESMRKYPPPRRIVAYTTGRPPMPTDPDERRMVGTSDGRV